MIATTQLNKQLLKIIFRVVETIFTTHKMVSTGAKMGVPGAGSIFTTAQRVFTTHKMISTGAKMSLPDAGNNFIDAQHIFTTAKMLSTGAKIISKCIFSFNYKPKTKKTCQFTLHKPMQILICN